MLIAVAVMSSSDDRTEELNLRLTARLKIRNATFTGASLIKLWSIGLAL
jgi:hypothetical protein